MDIEIDDDRLRGAIVEETDWGYTLHGTGDPAAMRLFKGLSLAVGCVCMFTCIGLWVMPGSTFAADLLPLKLTVSVFLFLLGCFFIQYSKAASRVEIQVDLTRRELRVMERVDGEPGSLIAIWPFIELGGIEVTGGRFVVKDRSGMLLGDLRIGSGRGPIRAATRGQTA